MLISGLSTGLRLFSVCHEFTRVAWHLLAGFAYGASLFPAFCFLIPPPLPPVLVSISLVSISPVFLFQCACGQLSRVAMATSPILTITSHPTKLRDQLPCSSPSPSEVVTGKIYRLYHYLLLLKMAWNC